VSAGNVYIDGKNVGDIENTILRDRQRLSRDGIVIVVVTITSEKKGIGLLHPEITSKGFIYNNESDDLFNKAKMRVLNMVKQYLKEMKTDLDLLKDLIKAELDSYFKEKTGINPMVIPIIIEV
jgi:ribonuclease J